MQDVASNKVDQKSEDEPRYSHLYAYFTDSEKRRINFAKRRLGRSKEWIYRTAVLKYVDEVLGEEGSHVVPFNS